MMDSAIRAFHSQFSYVPVLEQGPLGSYKRIVVCGMGGSHLAADLVMRLRPERSIMIHSDYNLPYIVPDEQRETLIVAVSYSGNTEETLSGFEIAIQQKLQVVAIATGGKLIERAKETKVPYIQIPNTGIQPRSATGFMFRALLVAIGDMDLLEETTLLATTLDNDAYEAHGKTLAASCKGSVPVIYASTRNKAIAYNWKIKLNETAKIPAFYNVIPEANHNEMTGFDRGGATAELSEKFHFLFITDSDDHPHIQKRMTVMMDLHKKRGNRVDQIPLEGITMGERVFGSLLTADWTAWHLGTSYGVETEQVPMVEEFKHLIA